MATWLGSANVPVGSGGHGLTAALICSCPSTFHSLPPTSPGCWPVRRTMMPHLLCFLPCYQLPCALFLFRGLDPMVDLWNCPSANSFNSHVATEENPVTWMSLECPSGPPRPSGENPTARQTSTTTVSGAPTCSAAVWYRPPVSSSTALR